MKVNYKYLSLLEHAASALEYTGKIMSTRVGEDEWKVHLTDSEVVSLLGRFSKWCDEEIKWFSYCLDEAIKKKKFCDDWHDGICLKNIFKGEINEF